MHYFLSFFYFLLLINNVLNNQVAPWVSWFARAGWFTRVQLIADKDHPASTSLFILGYFLIDSPLLPPSGAKHFVSSGCCREKRHSDPQSD